MPFSPRFPPGGPNTPTNARTPGPRDTGLPHPPKQQHTPATDPPAGHPSPPPTHDNPHPPTRNRTHHSATGIPQNHQFHLGLILIDVLRLILRPPTPRRPHPQGHGQSQSCGRTQGNRGPPDPQTGDLDTPALHRQAPPPGAGALTPPNRGPPQPRTGSQPKTRSQNQTGAQTITPPATAPSPTPPHAAPNTTNAKKATKATPP